jgi:hypothetical protein
MTNYNNPNDRTNPNNLPLTPEEESYRNGYDRGRVVSEDNLYRREVATEDRGTANGLLIGGIFAAFKSQL